MKRFKLTIILITAITLISFTGLAEAFIVDTGTPVGPEEVRLSNTQAGDGPQDLAVRFDLTQSHIITSIQGFLAESTGIAGTLSLTIYSGTVLDPQGGIVPDETSEIFSDTFSVPVGTDDDWYGLTGLTLELGPGSYWVAFEVDDGQTYNGNMPRHAPNALENEAFKRFQPAVQDEIWLDDDPFGDPFAPLELGLQVDGNVVPEPVTMVSLGFGLLGGIAVRRKQS